MDDKSSEIETLERIIWRTVISTRLERFSKVLELEDSRKHFGEEFVERISAKTDRLFRTTCFLGLAYAAIMLSLFVAQDPSKTEFEIFGYGFKNLAGCKEFLLFLAALTSPISSSVALYHRYLSELRRKVLSTLFPDQSVREFRSHIYTSDYFEPLLNRAQEYNVKPHGLTIGLAVIFALLFVLLTIVFLIASFILQVAVIYDVATNPASTKYINLFVVAFSLASIVLSWLMLIMQLPLPEVDLSGHERLNALRNADEAKYNEAIKRLSAESAKKEAIWIAASSGGFFVLIYALVAVSFFPQKLQQLGPLITFAVVGLAFCVFILAFLSKRIKRHLYKRYFREYPAGTDKDSRKFSRATKTIRLIRLTLQVLIPLAYSLFVLSRIW